jgi:hypothetical protein
MDDIESSNMSFTVHNSSGTTHIAATSDDNDVSGIELDKVGDLALLQVVLDGVVDFDLGVRIADCSAVMGDEVWYTTVADLNLLDWKWPVRQREELGTEENNVPLHSL